MNIIYKRLSLYGLNPRYNGYKYIKKLIEMSIYNPIEFKDTLKAVAKHYHRTESGINESARFVLKKANIETKVKDFVINVAVEIANELLTNEYNAKSDVNINK